MTYSLLFKDNKFVGKFKERLVEVADNLHRLAVEQWEKIDSDSSNSSQPPRRRSHPSRSLVFAPADRFR